MDDGSDNSNGMQENRALPPSRSMVNAMPWTDSDGDTGHYTGEVNSSSIPDGRGSMSYDDGPLLEGQWTEGYVEIDEGIEGVAVGDNNRTAPHFRKRRLGPHTLSTIIEQKSSLSLMGGLNDDTPGNQKKAAGSEGSVDADRRSQPESIHSYDDERSADGSVGIHSAEDEYAVPEKGKRDPSSFMEDIPLPPPRMEGIDAEFIQIVEQVEKKRFSFKTTSEQEQDTSGRSSESRGPSFMIDKDQQHDVENAPIVNKSKKLKSSNISSRQKRSRKWCLFFTLFTVFCLGAAAAVCWYTLVYLQDVEESSASTKSNSPQTTQQISKDPSDNAKPWDEDAPCANFLIKVVTDKFGNETSWELMYEGEEETGGVFGSDVSFSERKSPSFLVRDEIDRKRLRQHHNTSSNSRLLGSLVLRSGPYPYLDRSDPTYIENLSGQYTSKICLPKGYFKFVIHDVNGDGLCCKYGLGAYSLSFTGGREVYMSNGMFMEEEVKEFQVMEDDIATSALSASPSQLSMPRVSSFPSMAPTNQPRLIPTGVKNMSTMSRDVLTKGSSRSYGILFDIQIHSNISSLTVVGMDLLVEATYSVEYEVWTKAGSWQDVNETNPDYLSGFHQVSVGTINGVGISELSIIPREEFQDITIEGGAKQAFWVTLKEGSLLLLNYGRSQESLIQMSSTEFEVFYGNAVLNYPLEYAGTEEQFDDTKGFLGKLWYSLTDNAEASSFSPMATQSSTPSLGPTVVGDAPSELSLTLDTASSEPSSKITGNFTPATSPTENTTETSTPNPQPSKATSTPSYYTTLATSIQSSPDLSTNTASLTTNITKDLITTSPSPTSLINASSLPESLTTPIPTSSPPPTYLSTTSSPVMSTNTSNFTTLSFNDSYSVDSAINATVDENATLLSSSIPPTASSTPTNSPTVFDPVLRFTNSLLIEGTDGSSEFGFATDFSDDGSLLAVGAKKALNLLGEANGAVYLYSMNTFTNDLESSTESDIVTPEPFKILYGQSPGDEFGNAVALSRDGKHLVVGSRSENDVTGAIRIYQINDKDVTLGGVFSGQTPSGRAGWSVAISGDGSIVAMGATKGGSNGGGLIMTYQYQSPDWVPYGSVLEAQTSGDVAGYSISLSYDGTFMAAGSVKFAKSSQTRNAGKAAVYAIDGSEWVLRDEILGVAKGGLEGSSIALSQNGKMLVVGGMGYSGNSKQLAGICRIFEWNDTAYVSVYTMFGQTKKEELGSSAAVSDDGNIIACGGIAGRWGDNVASVSGVVRLWNRLTLREKIIWPQGDSTTVDDASFGSAVSLSGDGKLLFIGASTWSGGTSNISPGAMHIFDTSW